jgi:hypothetical protein
MDLREEVENALSGYRRTLEKQLASIGGSLASSFGRSRSKMKGMKVAAKYRGPDGRNVGWARGHSSVACCRDEGNRKETR